MCNIYVLLSKYPQVTDKLTKTKTRKRYRIVILFCFLHLNLIPLNLRRLFLVRYGVLTGYHSYSQQSPKMMYICYGSKMAMTNPSVRTPNMGDSVTIAWSHLTWGHLHTDTHTHGTRVTHMVHDYTHGSRIHKWNHGLRTWNKVNTNGLLVTVHTVQGIMTSMGYGARLYTYDGSKVTNMILGCTNGHWWHVPGTMVWGHT